MAIHPLNPLTSAHCRNLAEVLSSIPSLRATYELYERCGLDCAPQLAALLEQHNICTGIRSQFDPTGVAKVVYPVGEPRPLNVLKPEHWRVIDAVIAAWPSLQATLERYRSCGVDCESDLETLKALYETASQIKRELQPTAA